jgi:hypothetical protein
MRFVCPAPRARARTHPLRHGLGTQDKLALLVAIVDGDQRLDATAGPHVRQKVQQTNLVRLGASDAAARAVN